MKVGFVAVTGRPNVGKSSLLNKIVNYQVSITSSKPQTTRDQIKIIYNDSHSQIIFLDTPGIHKPKNKMGIFLNKTVFKAVSDADFNLFLTPINQKIGPGDKFIIEKLNKEKTIAVITKSDLATVPILDQKNKNLQVIGFKYIVSVSIKNEKSITGLISFLKKQLKEGNPYFDKTDITDVSMRFIVKEIIREAAIKKTWQEVPHSLDVEIIEFQENQKKTKVKAVIYIEKKSQKGILIGTKGSKIKAIKNFATKKINSLMSNKFFLEIKVKLDKNWTKKRLMKNAN